MTFTRAATAELAKKLGDAKLAQLESARPATVHSFALGLLQANPSASTLPKPLRIPDSWERRRLIYPDLALRLRLKGYDAKVPQVRQLEREMAAGWESLDPDLIMLSEMDPSLRNAFLGLWGEHRGVYGYTLLAELPYRALLAIEDYSVTVDNIHFMVVDEYQDLNKTDIRLLQRIADQGVRLLAVGDEDQSIYSFRMAAPEGILNFLDDFSSTNDYPLTVTRRFGGPLIAAANALIETATSRGQKPALSADSSAPSTRFAYLRFSSGKQEAEGVARLISHRIHGENVSPSGIAVLVRSNAATWTTILEPLLKKHEVPFVSVSWVDDALDEEEVRRGLAIVRLVLDNRDSLAWWTLLKTTAKITDDFIRYVYDSRLEAETFAQSLLRLNPDFENAPASVSANRAADLIEDTLKVVTSIQVEGAVLGPFAWGGWVLDQMDRSELSEDAIALFEEVGGFIDPEEGLQGFLSQLEPVGKDLAAASSESVRIMTIGGSKGLTLDTAIVMGVERGLMPLPPPKGKLEEEKRLLYVALTRAEQLCVLTFAKQRTGPIARSGKPNVAGPRGRSPLVEHLPEFAWTDGKTFIDEYVN